MAKGLILFFLFFALSIQSFSAQNRNILDAKYSPTSNVIAFTVGDNKSSGIKLYFPENDKLSKNLISDSLQNTTISEFEFSPQGDKIALLVTIDMITDLFLYTIENETLARCTNSSDLKNHNLSLAYKNSISWCDNQRVIFTSRHLGLVQQYIFNFTNNTLEANGRSEGNEYFFTYSPKNKESYYVASINNREPSVYKRKLGSSINTEISKDMNNHMTTMLSDEHNYLFYHIMPEISPRIYDLRSLKLLKNKLPKSNVHIIKCVEKDTTIIYSLSRFDSNESFPTKDLLSYNYITGKNQLISKNIEPGLGVACSPDGTKIIYTKASKKDLINPTQQNYKLDNLQTIVSDKNGHAKNFSYCGAVKDWNIDNKTVVFANGNRLVVLNILDGNQKSILMEN
jgi:hypothetical protein